MSKLGLYGRQPKAFAPAIRMTHTSLMPGILMMFDKGWYASTVQLFQATALSLMARIFLNNCVTCCSSKSWSGPVGAKSVNGGS